MERSNFKLMPDEIMRTKYSINMRYIWRMYHLELLAEFEAAKEMEE